MNYEMTLKFDGRNKLEIVDGASSSLYMKTAGATKTFFLQLGKQAGES